MVAAAIILTGAFFGIIGYLLGCCVTTEYFLNKKDDKKEDDE